MNFDPAKMQQLLTLSDSELWAVLRSIASAKGISLPTETPNAQEMQRLRALFQSGQSMSPEHAGRIVDAYKKK